MGAGRALFFPVFSPNNELIYRFCWNPNLLPKILLYLAHNILASLLRTNKEDRVTEFLSSLLETPIAKRSFLELLGIDPPDRMEELEVHTQYSNPDLSRPDLAILGGKLRIYGEIKTSNLRSLTKNQPLAYLENLKNASEETTEENEVFESVLFLLAPPGYPHTEEFSAQTRQWLKKNPTFQCQLVCVDWSDFFKYFRLQGLASLSPYFNDFCNLLESWYTPKPFAFSPSEIFLLKGMEEDRGPLQQHFALIEIMKTSQVPLLFDKIEQFIWDLKQALALPEPFWSSKSRGKYENGLYIGKGDKHLLWIGNWDAAWREDMPLAVGYEQDWEFDPETFTSIFGPTKNIEGYSVWGIPGELLTSPNLLTDLSTRVQNYLTKLTEPRK